MGLGRNKMEFAYAMAKHSTATMWQLERLLYCGATYRRYAETHCNRELTELEQVKYRRVANRILDICKEFGGIPVFQGDPRGNTVKIKVYDGYTNDFGSEGICVPTS